MKKYLSLLLVVILCCSLIFTLSACSKGNKIDIQEPNDNNQVITQDKLPVGIGVETIERDVLQALRYLMPMEKYIETVDETIGKKILNQVKEELKRNINAYENVTEFEEEQVITKKIKYENSDYFLISGKLNGNYFRILYSGSQSATGYVVVNCYIQTDGNFDILDTIVK